MTQTLLEPDKQKGIEELLGRCVVKVMAPGDQGTGFVIRQQWVLTCRHVVENVAVGGEVKVQDSAGHPLTAIVRAKFPSDDQPDLQGVLRWPDLALLELDDDGRDIPAVLTDTREVRAGDRLLVGGYPANTSVAYQTREFTAGPANNRDDAGHHYLSLKAESVEPGLSGSPVLAPSGFVCGYVRLTRGAGTVLGGWVVPLAEVVPEIEDLRLAHGNPGIAAKAWADVLKGLWLKDYGRDEHGARFDADETAPVLINIEVLQVPGQPGSDVSEWDVCVKTGAGVTKRVKTADLGDGVLDAVDHWSRRHQLASKPQVDLLGRVLYRALMPPEISDAVRDLNENEYPLVRLQIDAGNSLAAIPWEYAQMGGLGVATTPKWAFSRYVAHSKAKLHRADRARVLIVVNGSPGAQTNDVARQMDVTLTSKCKRIEFDVRQAQNFSDFTELLHDGPWDVVHYLGVAWSDGALGFARDYVRPGESDLTRVEWATVSETISGAGTKVVVLQLDARRSDPSPPMSGFLGLLDPGNQVRALVLAEHAATFDHVMAFSVRFYQLLDKGYSVEKTVQEIRKGLQDAPPPTGVRDEMDHAAFGTVSVITTQEGNIRLLTSEPAGDSPVGAAKTRQLIADGLREAPGSAPGPWAPDTGNSVPRQAGFDR